MCKFQSKMLIYSLDVKKKNFIGLAAFFNFQTILTAQVDNYYKKKFLYVRKNIK